MQDCARNVRSRLKVSKLSLIAGVILLIDQLSKYLVHLKLIPGESIPVIKNVFHISLIHNTGCAFGMFQHQTTVLRGLSILTIVMILVFFRQIARSERILQVGTALLMGGACGNLVDRLRFGYVVDFLDFKIWPVFNLADSAVTVGVVLILWKLCHKKAQ